MKLGIDVSQIVYPGGVGVYIRNLVKNLIDVDHKNQYLVFGASLRKKAVLDKFFNQLKKQNLSKKFYLLPNTLTSLLFNNLRYPRIEFFTGKIDLFHSSDWTEPKTCCPKVTTVHDLAPIIYPKLHDPKIVKVFKIKLDLVKKESTLIMAVSQSTKKDLVQKLGIKETKIRVIYEALDEEFSQVKEDKEFIGKLNLKKFILSDAAKNPRKNLKNLLEAYSRLKDEQLKLVLVGQPMWEEEQILSLINDSMVKDKIIYLQSVSPAQLKALYRYAEAAVFPSFYEGFGLSILEAISCGCPVVCSNTSSFPEVAGEGAIFFDPNKSEQIYRAIKALIGNQSVRNRLREKGFQQVKKFSWRKAAKQTLEVYEEVLEC